METKYLGEVPLSSLMLGTVQFGLPYGVNNTHGQPPYETARDILAVAYEGGVRCLDTAPKYGESEDVLGKAMAELGIADQMTVVSKIIGIAEDSSPAAVGKVIEDSVTDSLRRLRLERLPICLFHMEQNAVYMDELLKVQEKGLVQHVGVSTMTPDKTAAIIEKGQAEALQIPTNMLEQRFNRRGLFKAAAAKGIAVFIRSVYLQGLIPMPESDILPELAEVIPVRRGLETIAREAGMTISELAMRYVMALEGVTCTIVGVETVEQMRENLAISASGPLEPAMCRAIEEAVPDLPELILTPARWSKRMPDTKPLKV